MPEGGDEAVGNAQTCKRKGGVRPADRPDDTTAMNMHDSVCDNPMRSGRDRIVTLSALGLGLAFGAAAGMAWRRRTSYDFRDRIAVITGGSRGLGLELARALAGRGAHLVLLARDEAELERAEELLRDFGVHVFTVACDVTRQEEVNCAIDEAFGVFGRIDILINNAGVIQFGPLEHMTLADFDEALAVHLYGPLY